MRGNENKVLVGMVIVAVLLVLGAWKFFYSADVEKADQIQNEIDQRQTRINELNEKNANRSMYEAGIANSSDIIDTILSLYGPGNTAEKTIMMIVDLCKKTGISVSDIALQDNKQVYPVLTDDSSSEEETEEDGTKLKIYKSGVSLTISSGYTQLKKLTDYVNSYPERMNSENFSVVFDAQTGKLKVTMVVNLYSVSDDKHQYVAPIIEDIDLGSDNIFKTKDYVFEEETEENAENSENNNQAENSESNSVTSDENSEN